MPLPTKVLVSNRGEIAVRVMRGCKQLGIQTVAVYSEADANTPHVLMADEAVCIGPAPSTDSYLRSDRVLAAAKQTGADAVHPGYGFLSENTDFAKAVVDAGMIWIGPPPSAIAAMGSKTESRALMQAAGVPVVPGTTEPVEDAAEALRIAKDIGFPVMLKAASGGGGKGMRRVDDAEALEGALRSAQSEAQSAFGDGAVYIEKFVVNPRHVEVQVLSDAHGTHLHLFERDCSIQRRHQKVIEESPCPILRPEVRAQMTKVATDAAKAVDYVGAGTVEFLLGADQSFYFLEMNTRLQVEHPITEMVTGVDLVAAQLRIAGGEPLWFSQDEVQQNGHAIECRIYAEDPGQDWAPSPGPVPFYDEPKGPQVRVDSGIQSGGEVPIYYDPMAAKLITWGKDREEARLEMLKALANYRISGIQTTIPFFVQAMKDSDFIENRIDTGFLTPERMQALCVGYAEHQDVATIAAAIARFEADEKSLPQPAPTTRWRWSYR